MQQLLWAARKWHNHATRQRDQRYRRRAAGSFAATWAATASTPGRAVASDGTKSATTIALGLYTAYNTAATLASIPAGRLADRLGTRGPILVLASAVAAFAAPFALFSLNATTIAALTAPFLLAGIGIGAAETAENSAVASLAPPDLRGSAFGMLAALQALGNLTASTLAGILWTAMSPTAAFTYLTAWMILALAGLLATA